MQEWAEDAEERSKEIEQLRQSKQRQMNRSAKPRYSKGRRRHR